MSLYLKGRSCGLITKLFKNFQLHPLNFKRSSSSCSGGGAAGKKKPLRTYNIPHPPKDPPEDYNPSCMEHEAFEVPDFVPAAVFRPFVLNCEILGPGADKRCCYKNPEYYSFHRYSFAALHVATMKIREQRIKDGGVYCIYDKDDYEKENCSGDDNKCCS